MAELELLLYVITTTQSVIFILLVILALLVSLEAGITSVNWDYRKHTRNASFFECAVTPSLLSQVKYSFPAYAGIFAFIVYDLDLLFFFPEGVYQETWSSYQGFFFFSYLFFFALALVVDLCVFYFHWDS